MEQFCRKPCTWRGWHIAFFLNMVLRLTFRGSFSFFLSQSSHLLTILLDRRTGLTCQKQIHYLASILTLRTYKTNHFVKNQNYSSESLPHIPVMKQTLKEMSSSMLFLHIRTMPSILGTYAIIAVQKKHIKKLTVTSPTYKLNFDHLENLNPGKLAEYPCFATWSP